MARGKRARCAKGRTGKIRLSWRGSDADEHRCHRHRGAKWCQWGNARPTPSSGRPIRATSSWGCPAELSPRRLSQGSPSSRGSRCSWAARLECGPQRGGAGGQLRKALCRIRRPATVCNRCCRAEGTCRSSAKSGVGQGSAARGRPHGLSQRSFGRSPGVGSKLGAVVHCELARVSTS